MIFGLFIDLMQGNDRATIREESAEIVRGQRRFSRKPKAAILASVASAAGKLLAHVPERETFSKGARVGDADLDRILADLRRRRAEIDEMIRRNTKPGETSDGGEKEEEPIRSEDGSE